MGSDESGFSFFYERRSVTMKILITDESHLKEIRPVTRQELEACKKVIREGFQTVEKDANLLGENYEDDGAFIQIGRLFEDFDKGNHMFACFIDRQPIGFIEIDKLDKEGEFSIEKLTVIPQFRHYGIGRELLLYGEEEVRKLGGYKLCLGIIDENNLLKEWYNKNGYQHKASMKYEHLPYTIGLMEKIL
jgi:ribosomal protein S18 acetylase RimI-like enzyme